MAKSSENEAMKLLRPLFSPLQGQGLVELRAIPKGVGHVKRQWTTSSAEIDEFVEKYGQRNSEYGCYFGVSKRSREGGTKSDVLGVTSLWADIDAVKDGDDPIEVAKVLEKSTLRPSAVVHSGGGLHCYWFLDEVMTKDDFLIVERANQRVQRAVGGDNVHDVTRILRLPGSYNTKRAKPVKVEVLWCEPHARGTAEDLLGLVLRQNATGKTIMGRALDIPRYEATEGDVSRELEKAQASFNKPRLTRNIYELWNNVRYGGGGNYVGIHEAQLHTTAMFHIGELPRDWIINETLRLTKVAVAKDPNAADWNMEAERKTITQMYDSWAVKWKRLKKTRRGSNG